jgi:hypothetical protein
MNAPFQASSVATAQGEIKRGDVMATRWMRRR